MQELRKNLRSVATNIVKIYEERLKEAVATDSPIDIIGVNAECMAESDKIDGYLEDFERRIKDRKGKLW